MRARSSALPSLPLSLSPSSLSVWRAADLPKPPAKPAGDSAADLTEALIPAGSAGSQKAERMTSPNYSACHSSYQMATQNVGVEVEAMARGCAAIAKMHPLGAPLLGNQSAASAPQSFPFKAQAKHCYRVYGAAVTGIKDLDLLIKDSAGAVAGEDSTDDPTPVVLEDGVVCFKKERGDRAGGGERGGDGRRRSRCRSGATRYP